MNFALILEALDVAAAIADAAARAKKTALALKAAAQQSRQLTPEESAALDARAAAIWASPEQQPSGR